MPCLAFVYLTENVVGDFSIKETTALFGQTLSVVMKLRPKELAASAIQVSGG
jgi:hypothetical protein